MAKTAWSVQAIDDLSNLEDYLAASSKKQAELVIDAILEAVGLLETVLKPLNDHKSPSSGGILWQIFKR